MTNKLRQNWHADRSEPQLMTPVKNRQRDSSAGQGRIKKTRLAAIQARSRGYVFQQQELSKKVQR